MAFVVAFTLVIPNNENGFDVPHCKGVKIYHVGTNVYNDYSEVFYQLKSSIRAVIERAIADIELAAYYSPGVVLHVGEITACAPAAEAIERFGLDRLDAMYRLHDILKQINIRCKVVRNAGQLFLEGDRSRNLPDSIIETAVAMALINFWQATPNARRFKQFYNSLKASTMLHRPNIEAYEIRRKPMRGFDY